MRIEMRSAFLALTMALVAPMAMSATPAVFATDDGAIRGFDPVAYFVESKPVRGLPEYSHDWNGASWRFVSTKNLEMFKAEPEKFSPQYGGYCAYAVSRGYTASIVPEAWKIVEHKLYLNFSLGVQKRWSKDIPGNIEKADANWPGVLE